MPKIIHEKAIKRILAKSIPINRHRDRLSQMRAWRITHITLRTLGYSGLLTGLLGLSLSSLSFSIPIQPVPIDVIEIIRTTRTSSTPKVSQSLKDTRPLRTSKQSLRLVQWQEQLNHRWRLGTIPQILLARTSIILVLSSIGIGIIWLMQVFFHRLPKPIYPLGREVTLRKTSP
jgi:hypothetical protein